MRGLSKTAAFLAITNFACMSSNQGAGDRSKASPELAKTASPEVETNDVSPSEDSSAGPDSPIVQDSSPSLADNKTDECQRLQREVEVPVFVDDADALILSVDQKCIKDAQGKDAVKPMVTAIGVPFSPEAARVIKKGHGNSNWEVVEFSIELRESKTKQNIFQAIKSRFGFDLPPHNLAFVPMLIEYWEFEGNNDAGVSVRPQLTVSGGGAKQWNKNAHDQKPLPIRLYGHDSSFIPGPHIYEARVTIHPRPRGVFDLSVQEIKVLSAEEIETVFSRCAEKVKNKSNCQTTFKRKTDISSSKNKDSLR